MACRPFVVRRITKRNGPSNPSTRSFIIITGTAVFIFISQPSTLLYPPFIQSLLISACISIMLGEGSSKIMSTRKIFFSTHVQIIMFDRIKHSFKSRHRRNADRPRRKSLIYIGIIRSINSQMLIENATQSRITSGKLHSRVSL